MLAGPFLIVGIFWLGWTGSAFGSRSLARSGTDLCFADYPSIHWAVPAASAILIGMSFTLVFISFLTYLGELCELFLALCNVR